MGNKIKKYKNKKCHPDLQGLGVHGSAVQTRLNLAENPRRVGNHTEPVLPSPRVQAHRRAEGERGASSLIGARRNYDNELFKLVPAPSS